MTTLSLSFGACDAQNRETVPVSTEAQELRDQAGLHPVDERPVAIPTSDGGMVGAQDPALRDKAGLKPVSGEDYPKTPEALRDHLNLKPDRKAPPQNEAEMRDRMDLHPERVEEQR